MKETFKSSGYRLSISINGSNKYTKMSYPLRNGVYTELETPQAVLHFDNSNRISHIKGKGKGWPHPHEWLKRTAGNDWVYYSTGGYSGVFEAIGEYYLPNLPYVTNSLIGGKPHEDPEISKLVNNWYSILVEASGQFADVADCKDTFFREALENSPDVLNKRAEALFQISNGRITVLPPDARHVDYDVIPVMVAEGCLYKCRFCKIKTSNTFRVKPQDELTWQLDTLRDLYGHNLTNYNSVFLGEHDALQSGTSTVLEAIQRSSKELNLAKSYMRGGNFFLFGSVDSLLATPEEFFAHLSKMPFHFYINVGLESADQKTLDYLGKPITSEKVKEVFFRSQDINDKYINVEVTSNFVMDSELPDGHYRAFLDLVRDSLSKKKPKGCIYMSPLKFGQPKRELLFVFNRFKVLSRLPTFLYIIQRL